MGSRKPNKHYCSQCADLGVTPHPLSHEYTACWLCERGALYALKIENKRKLWENLTRHVADEFEELGVEWTEDRILCVVLEVLSGTHEQYKAAIIADAAERKGWFGDS